MEPHIIDINADVVAVNVPFLFGLENVTKLRALLDVGNNTIISPHIKWKLPLCRKY